MAGASDRLTRPLSTHCARAGPVLPCGGGPNGLSCTGAAALVVAAGGDAAGTALGWLCGSQIGSTLGAGGVAAEACAGGLSVGLRACRGGGGWVPALREPVLRALSASPAVADGDGGGGRRSRAVRDS